MHGIIYALTFCLFYASAVEILKSYNEFYSSDDNGKVWNPINQIMATDTTNTQMNSTVYLSINNYYCMVEEVEDPFLILYGAKTWTFPVQDVNLTLSYPAVNPDAEFSDNEGYLITGFKVILYIDGVETKGYITDGGVLKESIVLTFVSRNINTLSYQFWLYGMPKRKLEIQLDSVYLCE